MILEYNFRSSRRKVLKTVISFNIGDNYLLDSFAKIVSSRPNITVLFNITFYSESLEIYVIKSNDCVDLSKIVSVKTPHPVI